MKYIKVQECTTTELVHTQYPEYKWETIFQHFKIIHLYALH